MLQTSSSKSDPYYLDCCYSNKRQPYIGVDQLCDKNAKFCIQHSCHINNEGLMHQMMPLRQFKRKIDQRKYNMQTKVNTLIETFTKFIDNLIQQIRQIKLKKCLELSMLWLRDLAASQDQYQLMKKIYRMDFKDVSCREIHSIYYKIIYNSALYTKQLNQLNCYQGICKALSELQDNKKLTQLLSQKITQIQGVITNGQLLKKILPDKKILNQHLKQVLLQQISEQQNYNITYNKSLLLQSSPTFKPFFSKYCIIPHITYHISLKTKYSNIMLGICGQKLKQNHDLANMDNLHYSQYSIVYNCANGNTYKQGMFISGSNAAIKDLNQIQIKLRLTDKQIFIMTNKCVLMRANIQAINGNMYLLFLGRTAGDYFQVSCDNDISADNVRVLGLIKQQQYHRKISKKQPKQKRQNEKEIELTIKNDDINDVPILQDIENYLGSNQSQSSSAIQNRRLDSVEDEDSHNDSPLMLNSVAKPNSNNTNQKYKDGSKTGQYEQIVQQQSNLQSTIGAQKYKQYTQNPPPSRVKYLKCQPHTNSNFKRYKPAQNINKNQIIPQNNEQNTTNVKQQEGWTVQKDKYLKQIRQKISKIKTKNMSKNPNINTQSDVFASSSENTNRQKKSNLMINSSNNMIEKSDEGNNDRYKAKQLSNSGQFSKVNINISDQGYSNPNASLIKMSLLSGGFRQGSDNLNQEQNKAKELLEMSQSLQPPLTYTKQQTIVKKIKKIKTPPKISQNLKQYNMNQSFQF